MSEEYEVIDKVIGKYHKFDIRKDAKGRFYVYRDGKHHKGWFDDLREAYALAESVKESYFS